MVGIRDLCGVAELILIDVGMLGNDANVPAQRPRPEQRPLRTPENLDSFYVNDARIHGVIDRRVIDIESGCVGTDNATQGDGTRTGHTKGARVTVAVR